MAESSSTMDTRILMHGFSYVLEFLITVAFNPLCVDEAHESTKDVLHEWHLLQ